MEHPPLKIIFAGTPHFAAMHLQGLLEAGEHEIIAVYTQPDRPAGRGRQLRPSPVKQIALQADIPVYQPPSLRDADAQRTLHDLQADLMVVVAYGLLLPPAVLEAPRLGCINVHASLLPRWRGAAPIQRAIESGDTETGVTIMQMDEGLDTGAMLLTARCAIAADETAASLHDKLAALGLPALNTALQQLATGTAVAVAQNDSLANYASKISKAEAEINWREPAAVIARKIRAFNPFPIAYTTLKGERVKIQLATIATAAATNNITATPGCIIGANSQAIIVACGENAVAISRLQLPGGKALDVSAVMNARAEQFAVGTVFGSSDDSEAAH